MLPSRYIDHGVLDEGSMGEIHKVYDRHLERIVAMKVIKRPLGGRGDVLRRFRDEALITARLQHPTIVPVHDRGVLEDGRPWFTMMVIEGESFEERLELGPRGDPALWLRRCVDALRAVSQGVAYAHELDVLHRDIKPANIRLGSLGQIYLLDWGIARVRDSLGDRAFPEGSPRMTGARGTAFGRSIGTWEYMAPEQAQGRPDEHGYWSDVFSLGAVLFHILSQRPVYLSPEQALQADVPSLRDTLERRQLTAPRELITLCRQCLAVRPEARPTAAEVARSLRSWLDGEERREEALEQLIQAQNALRDARRARAQQGPLTAQIEVERAAIKSWMPAAEKQRLRDLERQLKRQEARAFHADLRAEYTLQAALRTTPDLIEAQCALADLYRERLVRAERAERPLEVLRYTALLREQGLREHLEWLESPALLSLHTDPPGAAVTAFRLIDEDYRRVERRFIGLGRTPLDGRQLEPGNYILVLEKPGHHRVRYPVRLRRGEHWDGRPPGWERPYAVPLPPLGSLAEDECYVPAGWFDSGSPDRGVDALPPRRIWVDGFAVSRDPVTLGEYTAFLNALSPSEAAARLPPPTPSMRDKPRLERAGSRYEVAGEEGDREHFPVVMVTRADCLAYLAWASEQRGQRLRLIHAYEWEKAARGVDERLFPWGGEMEPSITNIIGSRQGPPRPCAVHAIPEDLSPYGVRGLGGNVRDLCCNSYLRMAPPDRSRLDVGGDPDPAEYLASRGGSYNGTVYFSRTVDRTGAPSDHRYLSVGFRRTRSLGPASAPPS